MMPVTVISSGFLVSLMTKFTDIFSDFIDALTSPINLLHSFSHSSVILAVISSRGVKLSHFLTLPIGRPPMMKELSVVTIIWNLVKPRKTALAEYDIVWKKRFKYQSLIQRGLFISCFPYFIHMTANISFKGKLLFLILTKTHKIYCKLSPYFHVVICILQQWI